MLCSIRRFGDDLDNFRRRLAEVHEIDYTQDWKPHGCLLYRWMEEEDRFEGMEASAFMQGNVAELEARTARLDGLAKTRQMGLEDVARMVEGCRRVSYCSRSPMTVRTVRTKLPLPQYVSRHRAVSSLVMLLA